GAQQGPAQRGGGAPEEHGRVLPDAVGGQPGGAPGPRAAAGGGHGPRRVQAGVPREEDRHGPAGVQR
ncbi:unnamed protein product, partial [Heterosigma akashiwo]